jgi:hypothetical protein
VSSDRFISTQFCDDIRQEVGNKFSLIGCYGPSIHVQPIPSVLPKLCAVVKVYTSLHRPFQKLVVRLLRDDKPIAELPFPAEGLATPASVLPGVRWQLFVAVMMMSPFPVEAACTLRVEAETGEEVLNGGTTWIEAPPSIEAQHQGTVGLATRGNVDFVP